MAFRFFILCLLFNFGVCFAQTQDSILPKKEIIKDSIIDGKDLTVKKIEAEKDSTSIKKLEDLDYSIIY